MVFILNFLPILFFNINFLFSNYKSIYLCKIIILILFSLYVSYFLLFLGSKNSLFQDENLYRKNLRQFFKRENSYFVYIAYLFYMFYIYYLTQNFQKTFYKYIKYKYTIDKHKPNKIIHWSCCFNNSFCWGSYKRKIYIRKDFLWSTPKRQNRP